MLKMATAPAVKNGGGNSRMGIATSRRARNVVSVCLLLAVSAHFRLSAHDLIAVTESGKMFVIDEVESDIKALAITLRSSGASMEDPVVDIAGIADLTELRDLTFYHVPQISSFDFLSACRSLERLVISFARVRNVDFLDSLPNLNLLHLEICDDWESDSGLPPNFPPISVLRLHRLRTSRSFDRTSGSKLNARSSKVGSSRKAP